MIILGIDPGSRKAGFAVIRCEGRKLSYVHSGVMAFHHIDPFVDRLGLIYKESAALIERFRPDAISVEALIYVKSVTALAKLAQARGAMLAAYMPSHQGKVFEYSPNLVKSSVSGHGHADKEGVDKALRLIFGNIKFSSHDESDALAIAVCHYLHLGSPIPVGGPSRGRSLKDQFAQHPKVRQALNLMEEKG